jgi:putative ABC transport system permease protein
MALGAGGGRVLRELFFEHFLLSALAGAGAWVRSAAALRSWLAETGASSSHDYSADTDTATYLAAIALMSAIFITLAPVLRLRHLDMNGALKGQTRSSTITLRTKHISAALVAAQMALAVVLIAGAGVLGRSLWNVLSADVGVKGPERVLIGQVVLPRERYRTAESRAGFFEEFRARIGSVPPPDPLAVDRQFFVLAQPRRHSPASEKRHGRVLLIDPPHQPQVLFALAHRRVVDVRPV